VLSLADAPDLPPLIFHGTPGTGDYVRFRSGAGTSGANDGGVRELFPHERRAILRLFYATAHPEEVWGLLDKMSDAEQLLLEAIWPIRMYFGADASVVLNVFRDPEGDSRTLFADVFTPLDVEEALRQMELFDSEWFLYRLASTPQLNFALAFA
jgi:hypothetical protein